MDLLEFLKKNLDVRKIFGIRELKIIEKQLMGINLTQSERNRLSRDVRRKLQSVKKLFEFENEFDLKKGANIKKIINYAKKIILESKYFPQIKKIILFGSAVENQLTYNSDLDMAVEFGHISLKEATMFRAYISGRVDDKVDVQVYNFLPAKIRKEINEKGKVIWVKE
jgi:predicted nucleotidyltransferase